MGPLGFCRILKCHTLRSPRVMTSLPLLVTIQPSLRRLSLTPFDGLIGLIYTPLPPLTPVHLRPMVIPSNTHGTPDTKVIGVPSEFYCQCSIPSGKQSNSMDSQGCFLILPELSIISGLTATPQVIGIGLCSNVTGCGIQSRNAYSWHDYM
jgi:hypothetical protein